MVTLLRRGSSCSCSCWHLLRASRRPSLAFFRHCRCRSKLWCRWRKRSGLREFYVRKEVPQGVLDFGVGVDSAPVHSHQIQQPDIVEPVAVLLYSSGQDRYSFFVDDVEGVILARARSLLICRKDLPLFELYVEVLAHFSEHVDEHEVIVEDSVFVFASEANDAIVFDLVSIVGLKLVCLDDLVPADSFVCLSLIPNGEDQWIQQIASSEGNKDKVFIELFLLVDASADHNRTAKESGSMVFDVQASSCSQPLVLLHVEDQQLCVESLPFLTLEADPSNYDQIVLVDLHSVETRRYLGRFSIASDLHPFPQLIVIPMEEGKSLKATLMVPSEQIDLFFRAEKSSIVPDGRKERVEASIWQWKQLKGSLHKGILIPLNRRCLDHLLTLVLNLLQLRDLLLKLQVSAGMDLVSKIVAEGGIEFMMIFGQSSLQFQLALLHFDNNMRQFLALLAILKECLGLDGSIDGLESVD